MVVHRIYTRWAFLLVLVQCAPSTAPLNPCTTFEEGFRSSQFDFSGVDLLFVIDSSSSMAQEQRRLAREIPTIIEAVFTGDVPPADGSRDFTPLRSVHVGVVTSDMGAGGFMASTCSRAGGDGVLVGGCGAEDRFLDFREHHDPSSFDAAASCLVEVGEDRCEIEQPLEAALKALTPSSAPITFSGATVGHADGFNDGFRRYDSILVIVILTDGDDCSAADPTLFEADSTRYPGDPALRCLDFPEALFPVERFAEGLLERGDPSLVVLAVIAGIPPGHDPASNEFDALLDHPAMQHDIDPTRTPIVRPSCAHAANGTATPPRRIVELAQQMDARGAQVSLHTTCQESYAGVSHAIGQAIADTLTVCLPRRIERGPNGLVPCELTETMPGTARCDPLAGREYIGQEIDWDGMSHEICRVRQVQPPEGGSEVVAGWYYDDGESAIEQCPPLRPQRIAYTRRPSNDALSRFSCRRFVGARGRSCARGCDDEEALGVFPLGLVCDEATDTCQAQCVTDADCAGLACEEGFCRNLTCR